MSNTTRLPATVGSASAFITSSKESGLGIWAQAGRAIELAYRGPAPISQAVRAAIAVALVTAPKLCSGWAL
jgi:hypothetical protein